MRKTFSLLKQHSSIILQITFGLLFVGLGIYFFRHEQAELSNVGDALMAANPAWLAWGGFLLVAFVVIQGMMYKRSFAAIQQEIRLRTGMLLYLKRNLVSVFLPAGMLTNMLFFNEEVEKKEEVTKTQIYFASSIFSVCSILSSIIIGIPALVWLLLKNSLSGEFVWGIFITALLVGLVIYIAVDIYKQGKVFRFLEKSVPEFSQVIDELKDQSLDKQKLWEVTGLSILIEIIGIAHLCIAIKALGGTPTVEAAVIGYALVLLLLMSSPFLRGIGAIEVVLTYALTLFGFSTELAISVSFLFRFFEFWAVLLLGVVALVTQRDNLLLRVLPAVLLFFLGLINILSAITPAIPDRLRVLTQIIPLYAIHASTWLILFSGIIMLALSIFLFRGLRNAWISAVALSALSLIAHLTKGIDWEEASLALITLGTLIYQRHHYFIKPDLKLAKRSFFPGLIVITGVIVFGTLAFYFLNPRHFNADFTLWESFQKAVSTFLLLNVDLNPGTGFGREFLLGMNLIGGLTLVYIAFLLLRPLIQHPDTTEDEDLLRAKALLEKYGRGSQDYFKTYYDKKFWFSPDGEGFIAFKTSRNYALVLENPVCADDAALARMVLGFDAYSRENGLRPAYYRIPEGDKKNYENLGKKLLPMGEEAVLDLETFTIQGKDNSALRNALNKLSRLGYTFQTKEPPQSDAYLQQLKAVSDNWLKDMERTEIAFSQGVFDEKELKRQTLLSLETPEGKVIGFVNLIPDYVSGEANFDLMRKTGDAPHGTMDFLFVKMFEYLKEAGFKRCNLGIVPMSGIGKPENLQEQVMKWAYERLDRFGHYKSLRGFKEKFKPDWQMMYLAYNAPFDLIYLPNALEQVIEP